MEDQVRRAGWPAWKQTRPPTSRHTNPPPLFSFHNAQALVSAKKVLETVRGQLSRSSGARAELGRFIEDETAFVRGLRG